MEPGTARIPARAQRDDLIQKTLPHPVRGRHHKSVGSGPTVTGTAHGIIRQLCMFCLLQKQCYTVQYLLPMGEPASWNRVQEDPVMEIAHTGVVGSGRSQPGQLKQVHVDALTRFRVLLPITERGVILSLLCCPSAK